MGFDAATSTITLDLLATTGFGCLMVFLGKAIVRRVKPFQDWGIPAPVVGGLLVALILSYLKITGLFAVQWTSTLGSHLMNLFFTCVGFGFSKTLLERGKKFCAGIALSVLLLVLLQGLLGMFLAQMLWREAWELHLHLVPYMKGWALWERRRLEFRPQQSA